MHKKIPYSHQLFLKLGAFYRALSLTVTDPLKPIDKPHFDHRMLIAGEDIRTHLENYREFTRIFYDIDEIANRRHGKSIDGKFSRSIDQLFNMTMIQTEFIARHRRRRKKEAFLDYPYSTDAVFFIPEYLELSVPLVFNTRRSKSGIKREAHLIRDLAEKIEILKENLSYVRISNGTETSEDYNSSLGGGCDLLAGRLERYNENNLREQLNKIL